jgi:hypothetical protein
MSGGEDDKTQIIRRPPSGGQEKTVVARPGGFAVPPGPPRGHVIGTDLKPQPPVSPGRPLEHTAAPAPAQGETIFVVPQPGTPADAPPFNPVVGWLTIVQGPGKGHFRPIYYGQNSIGRDPKQRVSFDFGDQKISRDTHAFIVYDDVQRRFFIRDNGKSNLVRHNGNLVMTPTEIGDRDHITIGDTTLLFVALCNSNFDWLAMDELAKS